MEQSKLRVVAMAEQCRALIGESEDHEPGLPRPLHPKHLRRMCLAIEKYAEQWPDVKLHRWVGFVQAGMLANGMLDLDGVKAMFDDVKQAYGEIGDDPDLIDHLDSESGFEMELGGQG